MTTIHPPRSEAPLHVFDDDWLALGFGSVIDPARSTVDMHHHLGDASRLWDAFKRLPEGDRKDRRVATPGGTERRVVRLPGTLGQPG